MFGSTGIIGPRVAGSSFVGPGMASPSSACRTTRYAIPAASRTKGNDISDSVAISMSPKCPTATSSKAMSARMPSDDGFFKIVMNRLIVPTKGQKNASL